MTDTNQTLSDKIRQARYGAVANPYQGTDKKVLFVCSMGILRSATGARIYADKHNTRSAGTHEEALIRTNEMLYRWADEIVFVNVENFDADVGKYADIFDEKGPNGVHVLKIPDQYEHMHPAIIEAFSTQYEPLDVR